jgi:hypothetical protein
VVFIHLHVIDEQTVVNLAFASNGLAGQHVAAVVADTEVRAAAVITELALRE